MRHEGKGEGAGTVGDLVILMEKYVQKHIL